MSLKDRNSVSFLKQFDITLDLAGTFWAGEDWRSKCIHLQKILEKKLDLKLCLNKNSFCSCIQYEASSGEGCGLRIRIKVYNKLLALLQSKGSVHYVGMATHKIFRPTYRQLKVL